MPECPNGHGVTKGTRFCRKCGAAVGVLPEDVTLSALDSVTHVRPAPATAATGPHERRRRPLMWAAIALSVVAGMGVVGAVLVSDESNNSARGAARSSTTTSTSSTTSSTTSTTTAAGPKVIVDPAPICVRDSTPLNLHATPGIHAEVVGLIMVGSCDLTDPPSGVSTRSTQDGGGFRQVRWRGLEGWVRTSAVSTTPAPTPEFAAGTEPGCTPQALLAGWYAAEFHAYAEDPQYRVVGSSCTGSESGSIAYARFERGKLNPTGRTTEALFRATTTGWQELAHSGPTLLPPDYGYSGVPQGTVDGLRSSAT